MSEFATFIADMPGFTDYARRLYLLIDRQAICVGRRLAAMHRSTALRARAGPPWIVAECHGLAEALDTDARLAAIKSLRAWATRPEGIGNTWINWYVTLLEAHISEKQKHLEAPKRSVVTAFQNRSPFRPTYHPLAH